MDTPSSHAPRRLIVGISGASGIIYGIRILQVLRAPVGGLFRHVSDLTRELAARVKALLPQLREALGSSFEIESEYEG